MIAIIEFIQDASFNTSDGYKDAKAACGYNGEIFTVQIVFLALSSTTILYTLVVAIKMYKRRGSYVDNHPKDIEIDGRSDSVEVLTLPDNSEA